MFFVSAAVGAVTAGFMDNLFGLSSWFSWKLFPHALLFLVCTIILGVGRYNALDSLIKVIGTILLISTLIAFTLALINGPSPSFQSANSTPIWDQAGIAFLIALMGWMPTAVDLSAWNSLWTVARIKQTGYRPSLKETLFEFNLGYWISAGLSVCFLTLGAFLLFGSGKTMPPGGAAFASEVISLYTSTMGEWSYFIIATAAFSIMFGTSIGVFDGYARAMERTSELVLEDLGKEQSTIDTRLAYRITLIVVAVGSFALIAAFLNNPDGFKLLVDVATTLSFLIAPFVAAINFRLVTQKNFPLEARPGLIMRIISWLGLVFLFGFSLLFLFG
jgi:Mn2+/Fe2+ NRAMP family transporter